MGGIESFTLSRGEGGAKGFGPTGFFFHFVAPPPPPIINNDLYHIYVLAHRCFWILNYSGILIKEQTYITTGVATYDTSKGNDLDISSHENIVRVYIYMYLYDRL